MQLGPRGIIVLSLLTREKITQVSHFQTGIIFTGYKMQSYTEVGNQQGFASGGRLALNQPHSKLFTEA